MPARARAVRRAHKRPFVRTAVLAAVACLTGCKEQPPANRYNVLAGNVVGCHTDTGELSVRGARRTTAGPAEDTFHCLITRDSEICINDRLSSIEEIQLGDAVELVGWWERSPEQKRFVVSFAYFDHPLPAPSPPELAPASAPAAKDGAAQEVQGEPREE
jgi:hypothetical protein